MAYRAAALKTLLRQVNTLQPLRDTESDGWIGDASHGARPSDHNPSPPVTGVVRAQDFDADGDPGFDLGRWLWDQLITGRDSRISYVIHRGRMFSSYPTRGYEGWEPRPYSGVNGHIKHVHVSVKPSGDTDGHDWRLLLPRVDSTPTPEPEDDDMLTVGQDQTLQKIATQVDEVSQATAALLKDERGIALSAKVDALTAFVASDRGLDPAALVEMLTRAAEQGARSALDSRIADARVDLTVTDREG